MELSSMSARTVSVCSLSETAVVIDMCSIVAIVSPDYDCPIREAAATSLERDSSLNKRSYAVETMKLAGPL